MDAENGNEVFESEDTSDEVSENEDSSDELLAIGKAPEQEPVRLEKEEGVEDPDKETSATEKKEQPSASCASRPSEGGKTCSCYSSRHSSLKTVRPLQRSLQMCMLCGRVVNGSRTNLEMSNQPIASPAGLEGPLLDVLPQSFAEGLPLLPGISLEDNSSEQDGRCSRSHQDTSLVTGRSQDGNIPVQIMTPRSSETSEQDGRCSSSPLACTSLMGRSQGKKIAVQNVCELFVQSPSPGIMVIIFLLEKTHQERNEKWYILYIIPEMERKVYESILKSYMDGETSQQGYKTRQIPFAVDNARSQEFHTVYVQQHITVSFEIENQWQENFHVTQDARRTFSFRVPNIQCDSKNRVAPGAKSQFRVEYVGEPGMLCQEQGKITLVIDSTIQSTLLFSISIWSSTQAPD